MTKAVFTFSESSSYDDQPEVRYHFPGTYRAAAQAAIGSSTTNRAGHSGRVVRQDDSRTLRRRA